MSATNVVIRLASRASLAARPWRVARVRISFTVRSTRPMAATWMVDGFGLKAVNWVRQIVRHNGAAIDIWSQDDKKLTRLISSNGRHLIWALVQKVEIRRLGLSPHVADLAGVRNLKKMVKVEFRVVTRLQSSNHQTWIAAHRAISYPCLPNASSLLGFHSVSWARMKEAARSTLRRYSRSIPPYTGRGYCSPA